MSIQVALRHNTYYKYDRPITLSPHVVRLKPAPHSRTPIKSYSLKISPPNHFLNWQQDPFGNYVARVVFPDKVTHLSIEVEVIAELVTINPFDFFLEENAEKIPFQYGDLLRKELNPYLEIVEHGKLLIELFEKSKAYLNDGSIDFLVNINQLVYEAINYTIRLEQGIQPCEETLEKKLGSCRDSAWVLVQLLRHHNLAARFCSGYLVQLKADQKSVDGPSGTEEDFTDLHAWAEVYLPGAGWIGLDATSGLLTGEGHIPLSCTPNPSSAAPISGLAEPCETVFSFENNVERIYETPRVTRPLGDTQWEQMLHLGEKVDQRLHAGDVRLTMGGEPTFVSTEDMESDQWNGAADGEEKRIKAYQLAVKLRNKFAPAGLIHQGQGKWYPGEAIPRWQYSIYWRKDNMPLWANINSIANPNEKSNYKNEDAKSLLTAIVKSIGIPTEAIHPMYEDEYYFLWEKGKLPRDTDPLNTGKEKSLEQKKLAEILSRGGNHPSGYALPLKYNVTLDAWESCMWKTSREKIFLTPGNSGLGYRLPLESLKSKKEDVEDTVIEPSPLDDLGPLDNISLTPNAAEQLADTNKITTALSVEIREGQLCVFLPPVIAMSHFVSLIGFIEKCTTALKYKIIIEGYQAPHDNRVEKLSVTPDPGVIEINVHPAKSWKDIVKNYDIIFEEARQCKLGAEKFMLDGRHTGTGGGNHITLGGISPADSPLLRKPDLLRSMLNFWHNHPSLSYLFSSAFVGPTSQAPRIDEGRRGMSQELEIAFGELDKLENPSPWMVDRIFRNILIDLTGNTHRAEFCIDKLYSPDSNTGRLGILELRGFDMPPNYQMCLTQLLLIRSLVASFWNKPYRQPLIHWGDALYDKFLLQHYVREDMQEVLKHLQSDGLDFNNDWLESFYEFRFPLIGEVTINDIHISVRNAIEPWNVLGEEMSSSGTARFVDSSVEKIEVIISGINTDRYLLLCNKVVIPLNATKTAGTYVAGIRYKAWNPPSALHPTIEPDTPIAIDIYDTWNNRSIGGCTYHVAHPGGRNYDNFPINSLEAEGRRITRFFKEDHTPKTHIANTYQENINQEISRSLVNNQEQRFIAETSIINPNLKGVNYTLDLRRVK